MAKKDSAKPLTRKQKQQWDHIIETLQEYLTTAEGLALYERMENLFARIHRSKQELPKLTIQEERALNFIRRKLNQGRSPSVREIGRALGLRSSRSAFRIIQRLIAKQQIERSSARQRHLLIKI